VNQTVQNIFYLILNEKLSYKIISLDTKQVFKVGTWNQLKNKLFITENIFYRTSHPPKNILHWNSAM